MSRSRPDPVDRASRAERVVERVRAIPEGYVRTYGDIDPRAPRLVGRILATTHNLPWHRVVRADGTIPQGLPQRELLRAEGVPMRGDRVDLEQARPPTGALAVARTSLQAAIDEVATRDPVLAQIVARIGPITHRPRDPDGPFGALVRAIVYQQLAGRAAQAIHGRLRTTVGEALTPATVTATPDPALRAAGLSANKLASLRDLSAKVLDGTVVLTRTSARSDEELIAQLVTVRGIGRWTAEMYLMFQLRRLDVWPVDDLGVRQGYALAWQLDPAPTPKQLAPLGDHFRPYRSIAARYCWAAVPLLRPGSTQPTLR
jgi:DNA-3-methyladenine glycosylase II